MISQAFIDHWGVDVNRESSRSGTGGNKLRLYKTFKQNFEVETYCTSVYNRSHKGALAKFRSGISIETDRYSGVCINDRKGFSCKDIVEDETHVLLYCPQYIFLRNVLVTAAEHVLDGFANLFNAEIVICFLSNPFIGKLSAKICHLILNLKT